VQHTQKQGAHTSVTHSHFKPEVRSDGCYLMDDTVITWDAEAGQKFQTIWKRTGAATTVDSSHFANYNRLRADEAADHPPAEPEWEPEGVVLVELGLAE